MVVEVEPVELESDGSGSLDNEAKPTLPEKETVQIEESQIIIQSPEGNAEEEVECKQISDSASALQNGPTIRKQATITAWLTKTSS
jgi:hypothetical protein